MIVRPAGNRLQLITQPDHAHLARRIMEQCSGLQDHARRDSILHAIGEHDNGWAEADAAPLVDPGTAAIADFVSAPLRIRHEVWPRGVARLAADPWAAALVAQHAITVYDRFRVHTDWMSFFATMETARNDRLRARGWLLKDLLADYSFVRLGDLISLTFCTEWTDNQRFAEWTVRLAGNRVHVAPDLFEGKTIPIAIAAVEIPDRPYRSDEDLREAIQTGATTTLRGRVGQGAAHPGVER